MNEQLDLKQILLQILQIIGYQEDKDAYVNKFIAVCWERTFLLLLDTLPENKQKLFFADLKEKTKIDEAKKIIMHYFTQEQINDSLEKASREEFDAFLKTITPSLTKEKEGELQSYLNSLQEQSSNKTPEFTS